MTLTTQQLVERFLTLDTPTVSDSMDKLKIKCGCPGMVPIVLGKKIVGPAFTVKYIPIGEVKGTVGDYIDDCQPGDVVVLDNGGRTDGTVWGDILTYVATSKGIAGTVIDGVCRDVDGIRALGYPMFSKGHFMVTGKDRYMVQSVNETVQLSGIQVRPGDLIMGDESGVLVIPRNRAEEVLSIAQDIHHAEQRILDAVKAGATLGEARRIHKYHELQRGG